jgi:negative regulator of sigma-B (phosphoserine phosphatase)
MTRPLLEIGIAEMVAPGEVRSGDRCFVHQSGNQALLGVIDGLGHGEEAGAAAETAGAVLAGPMPRSLTALLHSCHERLRDTRGAALTLMAFDGATSRLEWIGVGNVVAVLLHPEPTGRLRSKELYVRSGVAGKQLPSIIASTARLARGDMVVAATDGVHYSFIEGIRRIEPPQQLAERLLRSYGTGRDDALVVVALIQREVA